MPKKTVLITGASGSMGSEVLKAVMAADVFKGLVLLRPKKANEKLKKALAKRYGAQIEVMFGDLAHFADCLKAAQRADYIINCAAVIPPASDKNPQAAEKTNYLGAKNLVEALKAAQNPDLKKLVHIGSVAEYGNRFFPLHWGRTGDPLLPSPYDYYAVTKLKGERWVVESGLKHWVSLRQSGILYDNVLTGNLNDGLIFHTCWNTPIEWTTAADSGRLIKNLLLKEEAGSLPPSFWQKCYNIGNGEAARVTGFETLNRGFSLLGHPVSRFFKPHWNSARNFHSFWYLDSDQLNDLLDFRRDTFEGFFEKLAKKLWYFKLAKPFSGLVRKFAIERLLEDRNAPLFWVKSNATGRIKAFYGSQDSFNSIARSFKNYPLVASKNLKNLAEAELLDLRGRQELNEEDFAIISDNCYRGQNKAVILSHGYDESKPGHELSLGDMQAAACFRGGLCLSPAMKKGDLAGRLLWQCHNGHQFLASPYTVLKAGFWCAQCCEPVPWNFDALAKKIPFFAQAWYNSHHPGEDNFYPADSYKDIL